MNYLEAVPRPLVLSTLKRSSAIIALGLVLSPIACGSSSDTETEVGDGDRGAAGDGDGDASGAELLASPGTAGLTGYCTATFTAVTDLSLDWGVGFTAQAGDTFLVVGANRRRSPVMWWALRRTWCWRRIVACWRSESTMNPLPLS